MTHKPARTLAVFFLLASTTGALAQASRWAQFPVLPGPDDQEHPDIDGTMVVWQEFVSEFGDYDIYVVDVNPTPYPLTEGIEPREWMRAVQQMATEFREAFLS